MYPQVSSAHRDPYENFYCVVHGQKTFDLLPPAFLPRMREVMAPVARFKSSPNGWTVEPEKGAEPVRWATTRIGSGESNAAGLASCHVTLRAGECLYLPALWWHQVSQLELTIAVNYWHDMDFDHRWVFSEFVKASFLPRQLPPLLPDSVFKTCDEPNFCERCQ